MNQVAFTLVWKVINISYVSLEYKAVFILSGVAPTYHIENIIYTN